MGFPIKIENQTRCSDEKADAFSCALQRRRYKRVLLLNFQWEGFPSDFRTRFNIAVSHSIDKKQFSKNTQVWFAIEQQGGGRWWRALVFYTRYVSDLYDSFQ